jgi:hypothetical protein
MIEKFRIRAWSICRNRIQATGGGLQASSLSAATGYR